MHEGNNLIYDPVLTMARSESPINFPSLESFNFMSDPNLQEVAVTTVDNATTPTTPPSHFENDLANISLPSTSGKINKASSLLYNSCKTNDKPFLCLINKDEVEAKIEQFSDIVSPPETITKSSDVQDSAFSSENTKFFLEQNSNQFEASFNQDRNVMSLNDINDFLLNPNSNPKPDGNIVNSHDVPVPSTSSSFWGPQKADGLDTPNKNALAARQNRAKKKVYVEGLEKSVEALQKENRDLTQKLESVTSGYEKRGAEIEYLKSVLVNEGKLSDILKNVPNIINSVGFPLKSSERSPCVGGMSASCCCQCKSYNNKKNISENPIPSSSFSPATSSPCSLQQRNINIMKDSPVGGVPEAQIKDPPFCGFSNNSQVDNKCLRKTLSGRITKNENQKCFSTWGAKSKKKVTKSTDPTS